MHYKHLVNLIIQLKLLTFSLYIHCYRGKGIKCPLHVSKLENGGLLSSDNQICVHGWYWFKEQLWLVDSQCGIVGILLKFSPVNWCEKFQALILKSFIHEKGLNFLSGMFNLVPHVKFLICIHFKDVSGVNVVW